MPDLYTKETIQDQPLGYSVFFRKSKITVYSLQETKQIENKRSTFLYISYKYKFSFFVMNLF